MMSFSVNSERVEHGTRVRAFARDGSSWVDEPRRPVGGFVHYDGWGDFHQERDPLGCNYYNRGIFRVH